MSTAGLSFSNCMTSHQLWGSADAQCIWSPLLFASAAPTAHLAALVDICYDQTKEYPLGHEEFVVYNVLFIERHFSDAMAE